MATPKKCKGPDRYKSYSKVLSVYFPHDVRATLKALAAEAGVPVSTLLVATVELGHARIAVADLQRLVTLPAELVPENLRAAVSKLQAAA